MLNITTWSAVCKVTPNLAIYVLEFSKDALQGDFTRSLVNDPPRTLWTRQLKVSGPIVTRHIPGRL